MTKPAALVHEVARLPFQGEEGGSTPTARLHFTPATAIEIAPLLHARHYLGPIRSARYAFAGWSDDVLVAAQAYRAPTARHMNSEDRLELVRWCLTPEAGKNAGSRMMAWAVRWLRRNAPEVRELVSYSDLTRHTGALYRASGWQPWPTHHAERFLADGVGYPSGHGSWDGTTRQEPKMRWRFEVVGLVDERTR